MKHLITLQQRVQDLIASRSGIELVFSPFWVGPKGPTRVHRWAILEYGHVLVDCPGDMSDLPYYPYYKEISPIDVHWGSAYPEYSSRDAGAYPYWFHSQAFKNSLLQYINIPPELVATSRWAYPYPDSAMQIIRAADRRIGRRQALTAWESTTDVDAKDILKRRFAKYYDEFRAHI